MKSIIELAHEAGFWQEHTYTWMCSGADLERFAQLVREQYRAELLAGVGEPVVWATPKTTLLSWDKQSRFWNELYTADQLVAAVLAERERCADTVNKYAKANMESDIMVNAFTHCAAAIRAGETK